MIVQLLPWRKIGLHRPPVVTGIVFALTAMANALQFVIPDMLDALQRTPAGLHGDWWRTLSSLFVQDGGAVGTISNLAFLLIIGALAEQILKPQRWLACYAGAGLLGEFAGYAWQPYGGGNSVAICGLAGALTVALWLGDARLPKLTPVFLLYWCGALLGTMFWPGLVIYAIGGLLVQIAVGRGLSAGRLAAAAAVVAAVVLIAATNIHGAALAAGTVIAAAIAFANHTARRPALSHVVQAHSQTAGSTSATRHR
jgi:membrane associated rhomboid family serine protease